MVIIDGVKYACERCIRGHRVTSCTHTDKPLKQIKPIGRPATQCKHCREARKDQSVHVSCCCGAKTPGSHSNGCPCYDPSQKCTCPSRKNKRKTSVSSSVKPYATRRIRSKSQVSSEVKDESLSDTSVKSPGTIAISVAGSHGMDPGAVISSSAVAANNAKPIPMPWDGAPPTNTPSPQVYGTQQGLSPQKVAEIQFSQAVLDWEQRHLPPPPRHHHHHPLPMTVPVPVPMASPADAMYTPSFSVEDGGASDADVGPPSMDVGWAPAFIGSMLDDFNPVVGMVPLMSDYDNGASVTDVATTQAPLLNPIQPSAGAVGMGQLPHHPQQPLAGGASQAHSVPSHTANSQAATASKGAADHWELVYVN